MAGLSGRVARLERAAGIRGGCPECGGAGRHALQVILTPEPPREPVGCPRCGKISVLKRLIIECDEHPYQDAPRQGAWPPPPARSTAP